MKRSHRVARIAEEMLAVLGTGRQVAPLSARFTDFGLEEAYEIAARVCDMRKPRGETSVGRKIGFTNRAAWGGYGISGPMWNYMFDSTVHDLAADSGTFALAGFPEPRIEPEIALHLARAPRVGMSESELLECIDWVAHGFEIVHSIFPGWQFTAADAVAAYGVHSGLLLGERHDVSAARAQWAEMLSGFSVELVGDDGARRSGHAANVLGGPLTALRFLVEELARYQASRPLGAGEIVTTGTLTEAMPAVAGQTWSTELRGIGMRGVRLRLE
ncbi:MAG: hydratase [Hyphomicrobiaceae bacterium]|nr:MAG: hydratase [Hyphomicrobiaceae bacterium]